MVKAQLYVACIGDPIPSGCVGGGNEVRWLHPGGKMSVKSWLRRSFRIAPWIALGPLAGVLGWRMGQSMAAKDRILAFLYGLAIVTTTAALILGADRALFALMD